MIRLILGALCALLLSAGGANAAEAPALGAPRKLLILATQGVDPAADTIGFNALVRNVTQAFSKSLADRIATDGVHAENVLDQNPAFNAGQKLAIYTVKYDITRVVLASLETEGVGDDTQLQLRIQYVDGTIIGSSGVATGFTANQTLDKRYVLRSAAGDIQMTMTELADDYVRFLKAHGDPLR